jgi:hypothetical protein
MIAREPRIHPVSIGALRPTQITVGMREVEAKRRRWRDFRKDKADFLGKHMIPVIRGPQDRFFVIDHHHLALALHQEGVKEIAVTVVADLHKLDKEAFWVYLDNRGWMHPFDRDGRRRGYQDVPKKITGLVDDPFRSLAGELRRTGGFAKDTTPFSEFLWADFLRRRIKPKLIDANFSSAMEQALHLAKSADADYLPGWCGPMAIE